MQLVWVVTVALVACKGGGGDKSSPPPPPPAPAYPLVVKSDAVLPLAKVPRPIHVVWLDATGAIQVAAAPKVWDGKLPVNRAAAPNLDAIAAEVAPPPAPLPTREEAIERARKGIDIWDSPTSFRDVIIIPEMVRGYERAPAVIATRDPEPVTALVMPHSTTKSGALLKALEQLGGFVGVVHKGDELGALRLAFHPKNRVHVDDEKREPWVELHIGSTGIDIVSIPSNGQTSVPWAKNTVDAKELTAVLRGFGKELPKLDVLVSPDVPAQRLIDTLIMLDGVEVTVVGLGAIPGPAKDRVAAVKKARMSRAGFNTATAAMQIVRINSQGDLAKPLIKEPVRAKLPELTACYDKVLATSPGLTGTVIAQFFITPNGTVVSSSAQGVDPAVASCIADVIKQIEFTKPKGGGGVQVNFTFRVWPYEA